MKIVTYDPSDKARKEKSQSSITIPKNSHVDVVTPRHRNKKERIIYKSGRASAQDEEEIKPEKPKTQRRSVV